MRDDTMLRLQTSLSEVRHWLPSAYRSADNKNVGFIHVKVRRNEGGADAIGFDLKTRSGRMPGKTYKPGETENWIDTRGY